MWGIPRSTKDADFVVELSSESICAVGRELGSGFQLDPQMSFESVTGTFRYRIHREDSAFTVELFLLGDDPHDRERFGRRVPKEVESRRVFVAAPEDVIITKLRWAVRANRRKDVDDIRDVLDVQTPANLDLAYIRRWCDTHGTRELFERLLTEALP